VILDRKLNADIEPTIRKDKRFNSDGLILHTLALSAFISFSLLFFNPVQIALSSTDRLGNLSLTFVFSLIALSLLSTLLLTLPKLRLGRIYFNFILCVAAYVFVYSALVNIDYGLFRGNGFGDEEKISSMSDSLYIFFEIAALVLCAGLLCRIPAKITHVPSIFFMTVFLGSTIESVMKIESHLEEQQIIAQQSIANENKDQEKIFRFSKNGQNIILFIADAAAGYLLPSLFEDAKLKENFSGFTYYKNAVAVGSFTMSNAAAMIGGHDYTPEAINADQSKTLFEHLAEAYNWLAFTLQTNDYETTFITPKWLKCDDFNLKLSCHESIFDLVEEFDIESNEKESNDYLTISVFTIFKMLPVSIRPIFYVSDTFKNALEGESQLLIALKNQYPHYLFIEQLSKLSEVVEGPNQFIHLWSTLLISPFSLQEYCKPITEADSDLYSMHAREISTRCMLNAFSNWLVWMKDQQVFDNTKIIIVADHGAHDYGKNWVKGAVNPMLMIKDFEQNDELQTSTTLIQNSDIASVICTALGSCDNMNLDPTVHALPNREVIYHLTTHGNLDFLLKSKKFEIKESFKIKGDLWEDSRFDLKGAAAQTADQ
jgi:hypothetical protein